jgi:hypothetical protein
MTMSYCEIILSRHREGEVPRIQVFSVTFQTFGGLSVKLKHCIFWLAPMSLDQTPERRASARYRLQLPVIFYWNDGSDRTGGGFTCDVALDGALIFSSNCPPIGSAVRIEVLIPSPDRSGDELRIECTGKVTRVVEQAGCFGVHGMFDDDHLTRQVLM